jgi:hypothetical protein
MADLVEMQCVCDPDEARGRVAHRLGSAGMSEVANASDATPEVADLLASRTDAWPEAQPLDTGNTPESVLAVAVALVGPW